MTEVIEPLKTPTGSAKPTFQQVLAASRPANERDRKAMEAGDVTKPNEPIRSDKPKVDPVPTAGAQPAKPVLDKPGTDPDEEILSGKRTPKNDDFKRIKHAATEASKERDALKSQHETATKELAELRKSRGDADKVAQVEKERDELKSKWQAVAAQFDSGFHAKYEAKVGEAIAKIKDAVPADKLDKISQLLQMPESDWKRKAMAELTEDMDPPTITDIMLANREVRDILIARKKELNDSGEVLKTSAEQRRKEQEDRKAAYVKAFDSTMAKKSTGDDALPVLQTREGDSAEVKAWNAGVAERSAIARSIFMDEFETPEEKAEAAISSASFPGALAVIKDLKARNAELEETMAKMQSSSPGIGAGGKGADGGQKMSFQERMAQRAL